MKLDDIRNLIAGLLAAGCLVTGHPASPAQEFGADSPFATPTTDPAADSGAAPADPNAAPAAPSFDLSEYGPAVQAILERERTTPAELLEGILLLVEFDEAELAKPWLDTLMDAAPDTRTQAELARRFGSHRLMRLAAAKSLGEPARGLAMSYLDAYAADVRDPARLSRLIEQLAAPSVDVQYAAISGLVEAGEAAAVALVASLDDATSVRHREAMQVALAELAPLSMGPLMAGLSATEASAADVRVASTRVISRIAPAHMAIWLLAPSRNESPSAGEQRQLAAEGLRRMIGSVPTRKRAEQMLQAAIDHHLDDTTPLDIDENGHVDVWYWDGAAQSPAMEKLDLHGAHIYFASLLADDLLSLQPESLDCLTQATMLRFAAPAPGGRERDGLVPEDAGVARQVLLGVMEQAIERDLPRAIAGAARELRTWPDPSVLLNHAPAESPLVAALMHPNRSVRWEALSTIMAVDPMNPYPGASRVMQTLAEFVQAGARPRAVVAVPTLEKAQTLAAAVNAHGYEVALATSGREAVLAAGANGGAGLVIIDARISGPTLREVLYQLRVNPASSGALVGIVGTGPGLEHGRKVARDHQTALAFADPQDAEDVAAIIERLQQSAAGGLELGALPDPQEMSRQAVAWLGSIAARQASFYHVRKYEPVVLQATYDVELAADAARILANFPSHESQLRLVDLVSNRATPITVREAAAEAFRTNVQRYGVQLTRSEILTQYDRYNASETADRATQAVLAHVLDTIEAGKKRTIGP